MSPYPDLPQVCPCRQQISGAWLLNRVSGCMLDQGAQQRSTHGLKSSMCSLAQFCDTGAMSTWWRCLFSNLHRHVADRIWFLQLWTVVSRIYRRRNWELNLIQFTNLRSGRTDGGLSTTPQFPSLPQASAGKALWTPPHTPSGNVWCRPSPEVPVSLLMS